MHVHATPFDDVVPAPPPPSPNVQCWCVDCFFSLGLVCARRRAEPAPILNPVGRGEVFMSSLPCLHMARVQFGGAKFCRSTVKNIPFVLIRMRLLGQDRDATAMRRERICAPHRPGFSLPSRSGQPCRAHAQHAAPGSLRHVATHTRNS